MSGLWPKSFAEAMDSVTMFTSKSLPFRQEMFIMSIASSQLKPRANSVSQPNIQSQCRNAECISRLNTCCKWAGHAGTSDRAVSDLNMPPARSSLIHHVGNEQQCLTTFNWLQRQHAALTAAQIILEHLPCIEEPEEANMPGTCAIETCQTQILCLTCGLHYRTDQGRLGGSGHAIPGAAQLIAL